MKREKQIFSMYDFIYSVVSTQEKTTMTRAKKLGIKMSFLDFVAIITKQWPVLSALIDLVQIYEERSYMKSELKAWKGWILSVEEKELSKAYDHFYLPSGSLPDVTFANSKMSDELTIGLILIVYYASRYATYDEIIEY